MNRKRTHSGVRGPKGNHVLRRFRERFLRRAVKGNRGHELRSKVNCYHL
jgi:hypothetical protein